MNQFIPLKIKSVSPQTEQAICIAFEIAPEQQQQFQYQPGQHLTIRHMSETGEIRRCYSICSDTQEDMSIAKAFAAQPVILLTTQIFVRANCSTYLPNANQSRQS